MSSRKGIFLLKLIIIKIDIVGYKNGI